jgi:outer membrane protein
VQTLDARNKQLQREAEDYRNDSQTESQEAFQTVAQKVYPFLQEYAKRHGTAM